MKTVYNIQYRPMTEADYPDIEALIRKTWEIDEMCSEEVATSYCKVYRAGVVANSSFQIVAENEGKILGIAMGKNIKTFSLDPESKRICEEADAEMNAHPEAKAMNDGLQDIHAVYYKLSQMYEETGVKRKAHPKAKAENKDCPDSQSILDALINQKPSAFGGYLTFLVLDKGFHGAGIGKGLVTKMVERFKEEGIQCFYLYTDTTCNVGFYDHLGFERCETLAHTIETDRFKEDVEVYLYKYDIGKP